jgi:hypothetical protein
MPPPTSDDAALAARFSPVLRLDRDERLVPVDRARFISQAQLWLVYVCRKPKYKKFEMKVAERVDLDRSPSKPLSCPKNDQFRECHYYLRQPGVPIAGHVRHFLPVQTASLADGLPTVYWHVDQASHTIQYWFFYVYNDFLNKHQGDWEQITVGLDEAMDEPMIVGFSSHDRGQSRLWERLSPKLGRRDTHPIVYVARGSHANYFGAGHHRVSDCRNLPCDRSNGRKPPLGPDGYRLTPLGPPIFHGDYGPGNFIAHIHWGAGITVDDPQTRPTWSHPGEWLSRATDAG